MPRLYTLLAILVFPSLWAQPVRVPRHARAAAAFGPEIFVKSRDAPAVETRQFSRGQLRGPITLLVENGDAAQNRRVAGATITLNGTEVYGWSDFRQALRPKSVDLLEQNTLTVELEGAPGDFLSIAVVGSEYEFARDYDSLPTASPTSDGGSIDWRTKGAVTPVKNQGQCMADWAFSTTGTVEGSVDIALGTLHSFSEQQLVDCAKATRNRGCDGGSPAGGLDYLLTGGGAESEAAYPYTARDGSCKFNPGQVQSKISGIKRVLPGNESALRGAVASHGPVSAVIREGAWLVDYTVGIAKPPEPCGDDYAAVLVVGFDSAASTPYWIVKNSWGASWGEAGYFRLAMNGASCGIADFAVFATVKP
jgi:hypothetical protein